MAPTARPVTMLSQSVYLTALEAHLVRWRTKAFKFEFGVVATNASGESKGVILPFLFNGM